MYCNSTCLSTIENQQKLFIFVNNPAENLRAARMTCKEKYNATLASHLLPDDYVNLNNCCDVTQRSSPYRIGLLSNRDLVCKNGVNTTFHWTHVNNETRSCITGEPLSLKTPPTKYCHSVEIVFGSKIENVFNNSRWSECKNKSKFICQKIQPRTTTLLPEQGTTGTSIYTSPDVDAATIAGIAATSCIVLFLIFFFIFRRTEMFENLKFRFNFLLFRWSYSLQKHSKRNSNQKDNCR